MSKKKIEKLSNIQTDLDVAFINLAELLRKEYSSADEIIAYIKVDLIEAKINALKALEYHYRDHGAHIRIKKHYPKELKNALKLIEKYSENTVLANPYSDLQLKQKFK